MLSTSINGLVDRFDLAGVEIGEVGAGAVISHSKDWNLAREAVLSTRLAIDYRLHHFRWLAAPACRQRCNWRKDCHRAN